MYQKEKNEKTNEIEYRLVLSAKKLNECLAKVNFSPPKIQDILAQLKGKNFFSTMDLQSSFHQLEIYEPHRHVLTIQHKGELLRYAKLPQGLSISSQYLCFALTLALGTTLYRNAICYVDDVIGYTEGGIEKHAIDLQEIFEAFRKANFGINKKKCKFGYPKISFLGYMVDGEEFKPDPSKFVELEKLLLAKDKKHAKSIFAYFSHYRAFIKDFHKISKPILNAADPGQKFKWESEQEEAVRKLHEILLKNIALTHFDGERETILACDGSPNFGVGAILYQKCPKSKKFKPVSVFSRQFPKSQRNSSPHDAELLALFYSLQRFREELHSVKSFIIESDCNGLQFLDQLQHPSSRQARVMLYLTQFHGKYKIKYKPGKEQACPDFHSRNPNPLEDYNPEDEERDAWRLPDEEPRRPDICQANEIKSIQVLGNTEEPSITSKLLEERAEEEKRKGSTLAVVTRARAQAEKTKEDEKIEKLVMPGVTIPNEQEWRKQIIEAQSKEPKIREIKKELEKNEGKITHYRLREGIVYWVSEKEPSGKMKIYVPSSLRRKVLENCHDSILGAHYGARKTLALMETTYWWPEIKSDTKQYVASCQKCARFKPKLIKAGLLQPITSSRPFEKMACDFADFGRSRQGSCYAFVLIELFSGYVYAVPTKRCRAKDAANALKQLLPFIVAPETLICDAGTHFVGATFKEFVNSIGIENLNVVPPDAHFSNGAAESAIKRLNNAIKFYCKDNTEHWQDLLPTVLGTINGSIQYNGKSALEILYGVQRVAPGHLTSAGQDGEDKTEEFLDKREQIRKDMLVKKEQGQHAQKQRFDKHRVDENYEIGERVYYAMRPQNKFNYPGKLQPKYRRGVIISKDSPVSFSIRPEEGSRKVTRAHVSQMKKFVERPDHLQ